MNKIVLYWENLEILNKCLKFIENRSESFEAIHDDC